MSKVFVGTSGFNYPHWGDGVFYPAGLSQSKWLEYYAGHFKSVELNVTFYRLPKRTTFESWYKKTPVDFVFAIKGSRFITHVKKLANCKEPLALFFDNAEGLEEKLGMVLWQFPGNLHVNSDKLKKFCELIKKNETAIKIRHAFEFRHQSWFSNEIYKILKNYNFALCIAHSKAWPYQEVVTADFIYLRFHGGERLYSSNYTDKELNDWAVKIKNWLAESRDVYAYFNNDALGYAVSNAQVLAQMLE